MLIFNIENEEREDESRINKRESNIINIVIKSEKFIIKLRIKKNYHK
jgi:hypothetical protein